MQKMNYGSRAVAAHATSSHTSYQYSSSSHSSSSYSYSSSSSSSSGNNTCRSNAGYLSASNQSVGGATYAAGSAGQCAVRFVPRENGVHQIHVRQNAVPIPGSPFNVLVGKMDADPAKVGAYGDGLSKGRTHEPAKFIVNTSKAGSGALSVTVDGPSKVQLDCREIAEGHEFTYTPTVPGDYLIIIKFGGNSHIPGSPFRARITGTSRKEQMPVVVETVTKSSTIKTFAAARPLHDEDASKVTAKGSGLESAHVSRDATFAIDASRAGHNMLLVGVMGPRIPCDEVVIRHIGQAQYTATFRPSERGTHVIVIKWGDHHIPGSPFHVIVD